MWKTLSGDVDPYTYGGKWYQHEDGEDYAHVIELIPHEWYGLEDSKKYTGILSYVIIEDDQALHGAKQCAGMPDLNNADLSTAQKIELLHSYHGGDHELTLTGNNYSLMMRTLKGAAYTMPYVKIPDNLEAKWY